MERPGVPKVEESLTTYVWSMSPPLNPFLMFNWKVVVLLTVIVIILTV